MLEEFNLIDKLLALEESDVVLGETLLDHVGLVDYLHLDTLLESLDLFCSQVLEHLCAQDVRVDLAYFLLQVSQLHLIILYMSHLSR